jgi:diguanylate cyclase (GGDEF)-like protein
MPTDTKVSLNASASGLVLGDQRLVQVLHASIAAATLSMMVSITNGGWANVAVLSVTLSLLLLARWLTRIQRINQAANLMLGTLTLTLSVFIFRSDGIRDEAVSAFPGILLFASMFGTRRLFVALLAVICVVLTAVVSANLSGWHLNTVGELNWGTLVNVLVILLVTAFFVWLLAGDLRSALLRLAQDNQRLQDSNTRIELLAHHDSLTNLPNRVLARDRLEQAIAAARRSGAPVAVLFLDLDNFKTVNDSLGHAAGDALLCDVADRLQTNVRDSDTVSRQGGDEFLIVLSQLTNEEDASAAAAKLLVALNQPMQVMGHDLTASGSIGIAMFPKDGNEVDTLLKNADLAMYRAKESGRNTFQFFNADMNSSVLEDLHLGSGIRTALEQGDFRLYYQPQFDLKTGRIIGAEALLRWPHATLGFVSPARFIPIAERAGLINQLGSWVLQEACRQCRHWQDAGLPRLVVAVNVSPVQFRRDDIEHEVHNALTQWNINPAMLELELTESLLIANAGHVSGVMERLGKLGVQFSIDDFGTGYSNLSYLKRFAVDRLKIDQSFVRQLTEHAHDEGIVRAIIEMAHCLDMEVVAEGIEDLPTLQRLFELGCDFGQGYHWAPALPADEFAQFVATHDNT